MVRPNFENAVQPRAGMPKRHQKTLAGLGFFTNQRQAGLVGDRAAGFLLALLAFPVVPIVWQLLGDARGMQTMKQPYAHKHKMLFTSCNLGFQ